MKPHSLLAAEFRRNSIRTYVELSESKDLLDVFDSPR